MFSLGSRQIALLLKAPLQLEDLRLAKENPRLASRPLPLRSLCVRLRVSLTLRGPYDGTAAFYEPKQNTQKTYSITSNLLIETFACPINKSLCVTWAEYE